MGLRKGLRLAALGLVLMLVGAVAHRFWMAGVTVRFVPQQKEKVLDYLFLTVGGTKLRAEGLKGGDVEHFVFTPQVGAPLEVGFWNGEDNGGWTGPILHARHRLDITLDEEGLVSWHECDWPCW
ncbi:hypothetical protein POL68_21955 [Stigmatella sp. ncwal1]|uniref:Uncharacterized protein n=1 Tax=Stigmatella ashevillensis TaxID=2995309 RepID=A0ABT5DBU2_9BACT|nr:hypothetical protein [Stigmatella ashevillena]MDC0711149.1 hypothetical protein [Stigmatella ashevillena]